MRSLVKTVALGLLLLAHGFVINEVTVTKEEFSRLVRNTSSAADEEVVVIHTLQQIKDHVSSFLIRIEPGDVLIQSDLPPDYTVTLEANCRKKAVGRRIRIQGCNSQPPLLQQFLGIGRKHALAVNMTLRVKRTIDADVVFLLGRELGGQCYEYMKKTIPLQVSTIGVEALTLEVVLLRPHLEAVDGTPYLVFTFNTTTESQVLDWGLDHILTTNKTDCGIRFGGLKVASFCSRMLQFLLRAGRLGPLVQAAEPTLAPSILKRIEELFRIRVGEEVRLPLRVDTESGGERNTIYT